MLAYEQVTMTWSPNKVHSEFGVGSHASHGQHQGVAPMEIDRVGFNDNWNSGKGKGKGKNKGKHGKGKGGPSPHSKGKEKVLESSMAKASISISTNNSNKIDLELTRTCVCIATNLDTGNATAERSSVTNRTSKFDKWSKRPLAMHPHQQALHHLHLQEQPAMQDPL